ncbi:hypothetical protein ACFZCL_07545 [Streptomyces sp. NPDC008159]|uniref:hypothetical protein n=1 Tax=Streptomyces sp. NPDC008159 TaxID=3364817 RepID=UPI0036E88C72
MNTRLTRAATGLAATALAITGVIATPGTAAAAAASECTGWQHKEFDTIGVNLDVYVKLCVYRTSANNYYAKAYIDWADGGGGLSTGMDDLTVNLRLERNDADYRTASGDYTGAVNTFQESSGNAFSTTNYYSTTTGGWTADGNVHWDINNDGAGGDTWSLGGSPSI